MTLFYFFNYCLNYLIQIIQCYFCLFYMQPLFLFLQLTLIYVNPLDLDHYLFLSQYYTRICLDYLWRKIFESEIIRYIIIRDRENHIDNIYNYIDSDNDSEVDSEAFVTYYTSDTEYLDIVPIEEEEENLLTEEILENNSEDNDSEDNELYSESEIDKYNPFDYPEDEIDFYTLSFDDY